MPGTNPELIKNINSLKLRTDYMQRENTIIEQAFSSRELFWDNEKAKFDSLIAPISTSHLTSDNFSPNILNIPGYLFDNAVSPMQLHAYLPLVPKILFPSFEGCAVSNCQGLVLLARILNK